MTSTKQYRIRPHHGMCLYFFEGKGYSDGFTAHMAEVKEALTAQNGATLITLVGETDEICSACPHNKEGVCEAAEKVDAYDNGVLQYGGLQTGQTLSFHEFEETVEEKILRAGNGRKICGNCQWKDICHR